MGTVLPSVELNKIVLEIPLNIFAKPPDIDWL